MPQDEEIVTYSKATAVSLTLKSFILGWGMVFLYVVLNSYGSLALKNQIQKLGAWNFTTTKSYFSYFFALFSSWQTWVSLGGISAATGAWIIALGNLELSRAYPVAIGLNLLVVVSISLLIYQEPMSLSKILGVVLILAGVITLFR